MMATKQEQLVIVANLRQKTKDSAAAMRAARSQGLDSKAYKDARAIATETSSAYFQALGSLGQIKSDIAGLPDLPAQLQLSETAQLAASTAEYNKEMVALKAEELKLRRDCAWSMTPPESAVRSAHRTPAGGRECRLACSPMSSHRQRG